MDNKISLDLDETVKGKIDAALQKPTGLTKTKLVGVGTSGQENIEIGENLTLTNGKLAAAGGSVSPTLNLIDWGNGEIRTSITEEEKTNLDNGLYNQVMYAPSISSFSGMISTYIPSKIMTVGDSKAFSYFVANESGNIIGLIVSPFTIGEKDPTTGNYPIIINEDDEEFLGIDVDIPTIEGEVKWVTSGSFQHRTIVMKSKPDVSADKFILRYVDGDITNTILFNRVLHMTSPINFSGFVGNDYDYYYACDSTSTDIEARRVTPTGSGGDVSVQQVNAYGEGGATTIEKGKISTDLTGVDLKVPFVLNIYEDSTLSGTPTRLVMTNKIGEIYLGNFDFINHYLVQMTKGTDGKYSYSSNIIPNATKNTLFNKPILVSQDLVDPTPILPCTTSDNGKVLSVVNGQAQWVNAGGGGTKLYQHNIVLQENSNSEYLYIKHISSKQSKVTSITDLNTLLGTVPYTFGCSGEVKINNTWYNAVALYWGGSYAESSVMYNVPSEGEKDTSLTIYTRVADKVLPVE